MQDKLKDWIAVRNICKQGDLTMNKNFFTVSPWSIFFLLNYKIFSDEKNFNGVVFLGIEYMVIIGCLIKEQKSSPKFYGKIFIYKPVNK